MEETLNPYKYYYMMNKVDKINTYNNTYNIRRYINEYKYSGLKKVKIKPRRTH